MVSMKFRHSLNVQLIGKDLKKAERAYLRMAAARVRLKIKDQLRGTGGRGQSSTPGSPPLTKSKKRSNLRGSIAYDVDYRQMSARIGSRKYPGSVRDVPKVLEFGGTTVGGRVVVQKMKQGRDKKGRFTRKRKAGDPFVFYARKFTYKARPFIRPGFENMTPAIFEKIYIRAVRQVFMKK